MAELDVDVLEWVQAYLHETGHPQDAAEVRKAIAALENRERLRAAARRLIERADQPYGGIVMIPYVNELRAALEGCDD